MVDHLTTLKSVIEAMEKATPGTLSVDSDAETYAVHDGTGEVCAQFLSARAAVDAIEAVADAVAYVAAHNALPALKALVKELRDRRTASKVIAPWLSAAIDDPSVGAAMRADIETWFALAPEINDVVLAELLG